MQSSTSKCSINQTLKGRLKKAKRVCNSNIFWYPVQHFGACAKCSGLSDNELKFVNTLRKNSPHQHVAKPTRQRGSDSPHILDLVIASDNYVRQLY